MVAAAVALIGAALAAALLSDLAPAALGITAVVCLVAGEVCAVLAVIDAWRNRHPADPDRFGYSQSQTGFGVHEPATPAPAALVSAALTDCDLDDGWLYDDLPTAAIPATPTPWPRPTPDVDGRHRADRA